MTLIGDLFRNLRTSKRSIDQYLKNPVSEKRLGNLANGPKHCCNLDHGTFTVFIDHCEHNSVGKGLLYCYAKS